MSDDKTAAALLYLDTHPDSTISDIAKDIFDPDGDEELRVADRKVRYYLTEKVPELVEADESGSAATYRTRDDLVQSGLGRMEMMTFDGDEISVGLGGAVLYKLGDDTHLDVVGDIEIEYPDDE